MPTPTTPQSVSQADGWLKDAPGAEFSLDDLFPAEPSAPQSQQPQAADPQVQQPEEPLIRTRTGTVYKNLEDTIRGTEEKDTRIGQMREQIIALTGIDPITGKQLAVRQQAAPTAATPAEPDYSSDPNKYLSDLAEAAANRDAARYAATQRRFLSEQLAPYSQLLSNAAKYQAIENVSGEVKDIRQFIGSNAYNDTLAALPLVRDAITRAESDPSYASNLPDLYRTAYYASVGRQPRTPSTPSPAPAVRPTMGSNTPTPTPTTSNVSTMDLSSHEGRKAILERGKQFGMDNRLGDW